MELTLFSTARYTLLDQELFAAMPQDGTPVSTKELVYARLKKGPWDIKHPRNVISTTMTKLIDKVERNDEGFRIRRRRGKGDPEIIEPNRNPREIEYWLEPVKPKSQKRRAHAETRSALFD